jgi:hypothetical protein
MLLGRWMYLADAIDGTPVPPHGFRLLVRFSNFGDGSRGNAFVD